MGSKQQYYLEWFNTLTGATIFSENQFTNLSGELVMQFPTLTGDEQQPIVFFRVYPLDEASFKSAEMDTIIIETKIEITNNPNDGLNYPIITDWSSDNKNDADLTFVVTPNPTSGEIIVKTNLNEFMGAIWQLTNENGELLKSGDVHNSFLILNLTDCAAGVYYLKIVNENQKYVQKVIKN